MGGFIVERYWPGVTESDVRAIRAALERAGAPAVVFLGSILMPGDEVVMCRFEAPSAQQVARVNQQAGLRCDRVIEALFIE
jgi:Protein of unknown function (DUF4242)